MREESLEKLQSDTFQYFLREINLVNGLVKDNTGQNAPATITAGGLALAVYIVGVERGFISREEAIRRTLTILHFFANAPQGEGLDATGYKGFYYHFLDMETGQHMWQSELSTIDTTYLLAGALAAATYFDGNSQEEKEIRTLVDTLYRRADWQWTLNGRSTVSHGWTPENGFLPYRWQGYNEAILLYVLGLGSPTHPLPPESYEAWMQTYEWKRMYGHEFLYAAPLFIHQLSHVWIDFRGIQDAFMRAKQMDYFENSRRATYVQQAYAIHNPKGFRGYNEHTWGVSASDGPGNITRVVDGVKRCFFDYAARGIPDWPDDGTLAPWAVVSSLPFAPEIVLPTLEHMNETYPGVTSEYGFKCSFNPTFPTMDRNDSCWVSEGHYALDQGPIVLMIENYLTGFFWRLMQQCPYIVNGLRRAGFTGHWLNPI